MREKRLRNLRKKSLLNTRKGSSDDDDDDCCSRSDRRVLTLCVGLRFHDSGRCPLDAPGDAANTSDENCARDGEAAPATAMPACPMASVLSSVQRSTKRYSSSWLILVGGVGSARLRPVSSDGRRLVIIAEDIE